jgi:hypothetical protein
MMRLPVALALVLAGPVSAGGSGIVAAELAEPTTRYDHAVLGDGVEWGALRLTMADGQVRLIRLPEDRVFEDVTARLADLDGDGLPEVVVVDTDMARGGMLAVYDAEGRRAATAPFGRTHRWVAPAGIADLDGDGRVEIAYVDRPHLAQELVVVRLSGRRLVEVARLDGLTNHRIGEDVIRGGLRDCGAGPELVLATPDWTGARVVRLQDGTLEAGPVAAIDGTAGLDRALACP